MSIFREDGKKLPFRKLGLHFADFSQFELRRYAMKGKSKGNFYTLFSLYIRVAPPIGSYYKLEADGVSEQGRMSELQ